MRTSDRRSAATLLAFCLLMAAVLLSTATVASAAGVGPALVVGSADNGNEGNNLKVTLESLGLTVDRAADVPASISAYQSVWYIEAYAGLDAGERDVLVDYSGSGGNLYLTGERPCCETLNAGVQDVLHRTLKDTNVQVGGFGDIDGPFAFNSGVTDHVATVPNFLVDFIPHSPGGLDGIGGVNSANVLAQNSTTAVGAVWPEKDMTAGKGRIALLMDIDWLNDAERLPIVENLANFLSGGALCFGDNGGGLNWDEGPANCTAINTPTDATWKVSAPGGPAPQVVATPTGVKADCTATSAGNVTTLTCHLTDAAAVGAALSVTASGPSGSNTRHYRLRPKNDPRNVPPGQPLDSDWWNWPDGDADGLPDHWEQNGVWVKNQLLDLPALGAHSDHKDLFLYYEFQDGEEQTDETLNSMVAMFADAPMSNPDGSGGVRLHIKRGASIPSSVVGDFSLGSQDIIRVGTYSGYLRSREYGGGGVPPIYKWMLNFAASDSNKRRLCGSPPTTSDGCGGVKGLFAWTATGVSGTEAALNINLPAWDANARESARGFVEASNAAHELGHLLGLKHHGADATPTDDKKYKSIMSYAYSHFGLPGDGFLPLHHIDYSRPSTPNLDWRVGKNYGALTFISGQDGEIPDFYANASDDALPPNGEIPLELSESDAIKAATPESVRGFIAAYDIPAAPAVPTIEGATVNVQPGGSVDIDLHGVDPAGGQLSYVVDSAPQRGAASPTANGIRYTAASGATGSDTFTARAFNDVLGSDTATVVVNVVTPPAAESPAAVIAEPPPAAESPSLPLLGAGPIVSTPPAAARRLKVTLVRTRVTRRRVAFYVRLSEVARLSLRARIRVGGRLGASVSTRPKDMGAGRRALAVVVPRAGTYRVVLTARTADGRTFTLRRTVRVRR